MTGAIPYGRQSVGDDDVAAVEEILRGDWLTTGPAVGLFEDALSSISGDHPVVAVASGTGALHAAYHAAGLRPGRVLITTPLTFASTASVALHLGASVRFADVEDDHLTLDPASVSDAMSQEVACVTAVDYAGNLPDLKALAEVVRGSVLVEDASHSLGGSFDGRPVGDLADLTTYSFHPVKTITTAEGGAVVARDRSFEEPLRRFINHGLVKDRARLRHQDEGGWHQEVQTLGLNYRMPDVLAALGISQLRKLEHFVARRRQLVARYNEGLLDVDEIRRPLPRKGSDPVWHLYPIRVRSGRRRELYDGLRSSGVGVQVHYLPVHMQPLFEDLGFMRGQFPVAEAAYDELLSLPLFPGMTDGDQDRVVELVHSVLGA